jgi:hypothetical protein
MILYWCLQVEDFNNGSSYSPDDLAAMHLLSRASAANGCSYKLLSLLVNIHRIDRGLPWSAFPVTFLSDIIAHTKVLGQHLNF